MAKRHSTSLRSRQTGAGKPKAPAPQTPATPSLDKQFSALHWRLTLHICQLKLISISLADSYDGTPADIAAKQLVKDFDRLHEDFDRWDVSRSAAARSTSEAQP